MDDQEFSHDETSDLTSVNENSSGTGGGIVPPEDGSLQSSYGADLQNIADRGTPKTLDEFFENQEEPITVAGDSHTIKYEKVGDKWELGIASKWLRAYEIHQNLRTAGLRSAPITQAFATFRQSSIATDTAQDEYDEALGIEEAAGLRIKSARTQAGPNQKRAKTKADGEWSEANDALQQKGAVLTAARNEEKRLYREYIKLVIQSGDEAEQIVAEVLGAKMPVITKDSSLVAADDKKYRYHEGTVGDPIPIVWYKPRGEYKPIDVTDDGGTKKLNPFGQNAVKVGGIDYTFGVSAGNDPNNFGKYGAPIKNTPKHGKSRDNQQAYNEIFKDMGHQPSAHGEDGDHVLDLGFGGKDRIDNYWPLDSDTNQLAFKGWRGRYYLHYKKQQLADGSWEIERAPLNSGSLVGKYFYLKGNPQATDVPEQNAAAGNDTSKGNAGKIKLADGTIIDEI